MNLLRFPLWIYKTALGVSAQVILIPALLFAGTISEPGSTPRAPRTVDGITKWSSPVNNLSMRVLYTSIVDYADPIDIEVELREKSNQPVALLSDGSLALKELQLTLRLTDLHSSIEYEYWPSGPATCPGKASATNQTVWIRNDSTWSSYICFKVDCDPWKVDLARYNRDSIYAWKEAREVFVHESLPPGTYIGRLEVFGPLTESENWHGLLTSAPFTIAVKGQDTENQKHSFVFPRNLRLVKGPAVKWEPDAIDTVRVEVSPHHFLEYRITSDYGDLRAPGLPEVPVILLNRDLPRTFIQSQLSLKPKKRVVFVNGKTDMNWHFELVESLLAPKRGRSCGLPNRHWKLWETDLSIKITKSHFDSLTVSESEVYDYHTIIIPTTLCHDPKDALRVESISSMLREVRCPRGYRICSKVTFDTDSVIWSNGPRFLPVSLLPSDTVKSDITLKFDIYAYDPTIADLAELNDWDRILLWSGRTEMNGSAREFEITEEFSQPKPEPWPMCTYYIPSSFQMTDDIELIRDPTDSIKITLTRSPGTALLAAITSGTVCITQLPPDLEGVPIALTSAYLRSDTLTCRLDLYERPVGSTVFGSYETLWTQQYKVPLTKKQAKKLRKRIQKQEPSLFHRGTGVSFR